MKFLIFFILFSNLLSNSQSNLKLKVYNIYSEEEIKKIFKNFKVNKINKTKNGCKIELESLEDDFNLIKKPKKKKIIKEKNYFDYLWVLVLPFFVILYFLLTKLAEKFLFMPFDPYEKYKSSLNFLLKKHKRNKKKLFIISQYLRVYLHEKLGIPIKLSNEDAIDKFGRLGFDQSSLKDILKKIEDSQHPSYDMNNSDFNEILEKLENVIAKVEHKCEDF